MSITSTTQTEDDKRPECQGHDQGHVQGHHL